MKSQVAVEYLIIVSIALIILIPLALYGSRLFQDYNDNTRMSLASNTVKKLGDSINWVYSQGKPAKMSVQVYIPEGITNISLENRTILFKIRTSSGISDIYYTTVSDIKGSLPMNNAYYTVSLVAYENYVNISW